MFLLQAVIKLQYLGKLNNHKIWQVEVKVVPLVVGALGTNPKALGKHLDEMRMRVDLLQKVAFWGTARILRKTLEI